jgi:predicted CopG family antitoxin
MRDNLKTIRITEETYNKIKELAEKKGLKQITILEYLLKGKIGLEDLI